MALEGAAQLIAFSAVAACLSYAVAATAGPLRDRELFAVDRALGFDWQGLLASVDSRPALGRLLVMAYESLKPQLILVITLLGLGGHTAALHRFLMAVGITTLATILLSGLVPAIGVYAFLDLNPEALASFHPAAPDLHISAMNGLRDGQLHHLSLDALEGIITFPSLHAALGLLLTVSMWPFPWARWPGLSLNVMLIAATPLNGSHYFADVLAGCAIAVAALTVTNRITMRNTLPRSRLDRTASGLTDIGAAQTR